MIAARWADAEVGRPVNTAHAQDNEEMTVTAASKALKVGERGIYHANVVIKEGTDEEIAAPQWEPRKPLGGTRKPRREWQAPAGLKWAVELLGVWPVLGHPRASTLKISHASGFCTRKAPARSRGQSPGTVHHIPVQDRRLSH